MFEEKESFWKKKGFYLSACVMLVGVMAVGAIFFRKASLTGENKQMASVATQSPTATAASNAGKSALSKEKDAAQTNAEVSKNISASENDSKTKATVSPAKQKSNKAAKNSTVSKSKKSTKNKTTTKSTSKKTKETSATVKNSLSFNEESGLLWPVKGDVILKYSMSNTVYFKTLAQYKCNPGIAISSKIGTEVKAASDCCVTKVQKDDELGMTVTTDIGDKYTVMYGQLENISVIKGDKLAEGDVIGTVAEPTKYYTEEGCNLYMQVKQGKESVDPLLLLR